MLLVVKALVFLIFFVAVSEWKENQTPGSISTNTVIILCALCLCYLEYSVFINDPAQGVVGFEVVLKKKTSQLAIVLDFISFLFVLGKGVNVILDCVGLN